MSFAKLAVILLCGCGGASSTDAGPNDASPDAPVEAAPTPSIGCDLPENPGIMPHECVLYYDLSQHDHDEVMAKCVSPGFIVTSCPAAGVVGICHLAAGGFGKSNVDVAFQFVFTGTGSYEDEYRYNTTFGDSECGAAGGTWM